MGEALIVRRGGIPNLKVVKSSLDNENNTAVSGISDEKRYLVSTARYDGYDSFTHDAISVWLLDCGVLTPLGGKYWAAHSSDTYGSEDGTVGNLYFSDGELRYSNESAYDRVAICVVEIE